MHESVQQLSGMKNEKIAPPLSILLHVYCSFGWPSFLNYIRYQIEMFSISLLCRGQQMYDGSKVSKLVFTDKRYYVFLECSEVPRVGMFKGS